MAHFALTMTDGSVAIMQTVGRTTVTEALAKWHPDQRAKVVSHAAVRADEIPRDRTFRNAWKRTGEMIECDMEKSRVIHLARIRSERNRLLNDKDQEWLIAFSRGDTATANVIEADRQRLRDVPQTVDDQVKAATTPEALKAIWPAQFGEKPA